MKSTGEAKAPQLENFADYAPMCPILADTHVAPNYLKLRPTAKPNVPVASNLLTVVQPSGFTSVRSSPHLDCTPSTDLGFFFAQDIAKSKVMDPTQWEKNAKNGVLSQN
jgi:hypothetical protein